MVNALARKFRLDVTADLTLASGWLQVNGIQDFDPDITPNLEDAGAYDINGWGAKEPTLQEWQASATFLRRYTGGTYDPGQELIRACVGQFAAAARIGVRWYDKNGGPEANSGVAIPMWKRAQTGYKNLEAATVTFSGTDVPLNMNITNPGVAAAAPLLISALPSGQNSGKILTVTGSGFLGTTGVTVGGSGASSFVIQSDSVLLVVLNTATAGSAPLIVTNAVGASASFPYTRGA